MNAPLPSEKLKALVTEIEGFDDLKALRTLYLFVDTDAFPYDETGFKNLKEAFGIDGAQIPYNTGDVVYEEAAEAARQALTILANVLPASEAEQIRTTSERAHPINGSATINFFLIVALLCAFKKGRINVNILGNGIEIEFDRDQLVRISNVLLERADELLAYVKKLLQNPPSEEDDG